MLKAAIFDFDGTLADTYPLTIEILRQMAAEEQWPFPDSATIESLRSMTIRQMFKTLNVPLRRLPYLFTETRARLHDRIGEASPYNGIAPMLEDLKNRDLKRIILSSNTQEIIDSFLQKHRMPGFDDVEGYGKLFGKGRPLKRLLKKHGADRSSAVYIGDEVRDIDAARYAGIPVISVTWGFNTAELLARLKPDHMVDTPEELRDLLRRL
ncbi:MAG: Phosphoglycolate phosphatase [candidate division WS6 bacterium OLB20]|uniref:Phosphoglycolate phosphatase n=1 Tax=candidate division WS6 bacterium OLB20 TaxID=1617426 RepID=A0A136LZ89_9BACT|nr:MAG: Phosphoglycolate phosphatase [candidate division WS6 bacterium OLB20]